MKNTALQIATWGSIGFSILLLLGLDSGEITILQILPFMAFGTLGFISIYKNKDFRVGMATLAGIMALMNLGYQSGIDTIVWSIGLMLVLINK